MLEIEESTEAIRQTYRTASSYWYLNPWQLFSGNWLAREIIKKELKLYSEMYFLAKNFSQTENKKNMGENMKILVNE